MTICLIGVNDGYVKIIEDIYPNATATIHIDNDVSKPIQINRGVRQGDTISPKKITAAIEEEVFKKLNLEERGLNIDGEMLTDQRFADYVALITVSFCERHGKSTEQSQFNLRVHNEI